MAHLILLKGLFELEKMLRSWRGERSFHPDQKRAPSMLPAEKGPKSSVTSVKENAGLWLPVSSALPFTFRQRPYRGHD